MSTIIKNRDELLSHGNRRGRKIVLDIIEYAIKAVDAYEAVKKKVRIENSKLIVEGLIYDLSSVGDIFVIGAGKASFSIAQALDEILGSNIKRGGCNS
jgi:glycerate-2-kinase